MADDAPALSDIQALDPTALGALHDRHFPELYRYARYRLADAEVAEDAVSETFVRLLEALRAGRGPRTSLRGWLFGTMRHVVDDHYRLEYNRPVESLTGQDLPDEAEPGQVVEERQLHERLRRAMRHLTGEQQHVLALRFGGAYSLEETAVLVGSNVNAIKALQFRALQSLRRALSKETS
jgi:RNA polymerase sigma-70 factor (ECF subfamily)